MTIDWMVAGNGRSASLMAEAESHWDEILERAGRIVMEQTPGTPDPG